VHAAAPAVVFGSFVNVPPAHKPPVSRPPPNLLDDDAATAPPDPFGLGISSAAPPESPLPSLAPLAAALPPQTTSPSRVKLGEEGRKSSDPFASLIDL
jgi:hypothetical protein